MTPGKARIEYEATATDSDNGNTICIWFSPVHYAFMYSLNGERSSRRLPADLNGLTSMEKAFELLYRLREAGKPTDAEEETLP